MSNNGSKQIFGPDGKPLVTHVGLAVLKIPVGSPLPSPQLLNAIAKMTQCNIVTIPSEYDLYTGRLAFEQMESMHQAIHQVEKKFAAETLGGNNAATS